MPRNAVGTLYERLAEQVIPMSKWVVTVLVNDGRWVPVEVDAEAMDDALDYIYSLDWVENVVECQRVE